LPCSFSRSLRLLKHELASRSFPSTYCEHPADTTQYNQGGQGYGNYNPYGEAGNPYDQRDESYGNQGGYSDRPEPHQQGSSYYPQDNQRQGGYGTSILNRVAAVID
jgi:hypothetical protein